jgi:hypothetical protein
LGLSLKKSAGISIALVFITVGLGFRQRTSQTQQARNLYPTNQPTTHSTKKYMCHKKRGQKEIK